MVGLRRVLGPLARLLVALGNAVTPGRGYRDGPFQSEAELRDLVDIANPTSNAPIGQWKREYGHDAATVTACAGAFAAGMGASGVIPTFKHFPGLGRVTQNTDTSSGVTDTVTARDDAAVLTALTTAIAMWLVLH